jgi:NhaP-type Na+/H+ or K+/H+ antiporter
MLHGLMFQSDYVYHSFSLVLFYLSAFIICNRLNISGYLGILAVVLMWCKYPKKLCMRKMARFQ